MRKNTPTKKYARPNVTTDQQNDNTQIRYSIVAHDLIDIQDANILRLLLDLHRESRPWPRKERYMNLKFELEVGQVILKGPVLAVRWHVDKSTIWRWTRWLKRDGLIKCSKQHHYTIVSFTKQAFPVIGWKSVQYPRELPRELPRERMSKSKSLILLNDLDTKQGVMNKFTMGKNDFAATQGLILKNSPCSDWKDSGLNHEKLYWLITGICLQNHRDCSRAKSFCIPHLEKFSKKLKKYPLRDPSAGKRYIEVMIGDYFKKKGGD